MKTTKHAILKSALAMALILSLLAMALVMAVQAPKAYAAGVVPTAYDRASIQTALNNAPAGSVIDLSACPGATINLSAALTVDKDITLYSSKAITINSTAANRHIIINQAGTLTLQNITLQGNKGAANGGGGIEVSGAFSGGVTINATNSKVTNCQAQQGGGIANITANKNPLTINNLVISANLANSATNAYGGGIYSTGRLTLMGAAVANNQATGAVAFQGGGIWMSGGGTITDALISGNTTSALNLGYGTGDGAGIYVSPTTPLGTDYTLTIGGDTKIYGNNSLTDFQAGGGIAAHGGSFLHVTGNTEIGGPVPGQGNSANDGGGISLRNSCSLRVDENVQIHYNTASSGDGGGIAAGNKSAPFCELNVTITGNAQISHNGAIMDGGGLYASYIPTKNIPSPEDPGQFVSTGVVVQENAAITGNTANHNGGGLYVSSTLDIKAIAGVSAPGYPLISENTVTGYETQPNADPGGGGGVYVAGALTMNGGTVSLNEAKVSYIDMGDGLIIGGGYANGGGIWMSGGGTITDASIIGNKATGMPNRPLSGNGGGIYVSKAASGSLTIAGGTKLYGNSALVKGLSGGGIAVAGGSQLHIRDSAEVGGPGAGQGNSADAGGGGVYIVNRVALLVEDNASIQNNTVGGDGGGINSDGPLTISATGLSATGYPKVSGNTAAGNGGGVFCAATVGSQNTTISGAHISNNTAGVSGGGVATISENCLVDITDSLIAQNKAGDYAGGVFVLSLKNLTTNKVTFAGNTSAYPFPWRLSDWEAPGSDPDLSSYVNTYRSNIIDTTYSDLNCPDDPSWQPNRPYIAPDQYDNAYNEFDINCYIPDISYMLVFDKNGVNCIVFPDPVYPLPPWSDYRFGTEAKPVPTGGFPALAFVGWSAQPDSNIYKAGDTVRTKLDAVNITDHTAVYAIWGEDINKNGIADVLEARALVYDLNGGAGGPAENPVYFLDNTPGYSLSATVPTHPPVSGVDVCFIGWAAVPYTGIFSPGDLAPGTLTAVDIIDSDVTVYAAWGFDLNGNGIADLTERYTLAYDLNGGAGGPAENPVWGLAIQQGYTLSGIGENSAEAPTRDGDGTGAIVFIGWSADAGVAGQVYAAGDPAPATVTAVDITDADVTVYAAWGYDLNGNGLPDVLEAYSLTYDLNGGDVAWDVTNPVYLIAPLDGYALECQTLPQHADVGGTPVVFFGWTADQADAGGPVYRAEDDVPDGLATQIDITDADPNVTVWALWGFDTNGDGQADVLDQAVTLTYDLNGGLPWPYAKTAYFAQHPADRPLSYTLADEAPAHGGDADTGVAVVFIGWSADAATAGRVYAAGDPAPATVTAVDITDADVTVWAAWGLDQNGNGIADLTERYGLTYDYNGGLDEDGQALHANAGLAVQKGYPLDTSRPPFYTVGEGQGAVAFIGWTSERTGAVLAAGDTAPATVTAVDVYGDVTVYAAWGLDLNGNGIADVTERYTLAYDLNGGAGGPPENPVWGLAIQQGYTLAMTPAPVYAGSVTFFGWTQDAQAKGKVFGVGDDAPVTVTAVDIIDRDVTVYAAWGYDLNNNGIADVTERYSLVYDLNGGVGGPADSPVWGLAIQQGYTLAAMPAPTKTGQAFIGWTAEKAESAYAAGGTAPATLTAVDIIDNDVTVYAAWGYDLNNNGIADIFERYTLTYDLNGGSGGPAENPVGGLAVQAGYALHAAPAPTRDSDGTGAIVFIGWTALRHTHAYPASEDAPATLTTVDITDADVTVYAAWGYDLNGNGIADLFESAQPSVAAVTVGDMAIQGTGIAGATITLTLPGDAIKNTVVNSDGSWSISDISDLWPGQTIKATQTEAGKLESASTAVEVAPMPISEPPQINPVTVGDQSLTGKGEPGAIITVTFSDGTDVTTTVASDGTWGVLLPEIKAGQSLGVTQQVPGHAASPKETIKVAAQPISTTPTVDPVTVGDARVTGSGIPGASVTVTYPNGQTATATVAADGSWSVDAPELTAGGTVKATQKAAGMGPSAESTSEVAARPKSAQPTMDSIMVDDAMVTGTGVAGATVTVVLPSGTTQKTTVGADDTWAITLAAPEMLPAGATVFATQQRPGHDESDVHSKTIVDRDQSADPAIFAIVEWEKTVSGTGVAGATVLVGFPNGVSTAVLVDNNMRWTVNVPGSYILRPGETVTAIQTEPGKSPSGTATQRVSALPQSTSCTLNPISASDLFVTGTGIAGSTITVSLAGGQAMAATVGADGKWVLGLAAALSAGETVTATQTEAGKRASGATTQVVTSLTQSAAPAIKPVQAGSASVWGTGVPGATVTVTFTGMISVTAQVNGDGSWTATAPQALQPGDVVSATQREPGRAESGAATQSVPKLPQSEKPVITHPETGDKTVSGTGAPGGSVTVTMPDGSQKTTTTNPNGNWAVSTPGPLAKGDEVTAIKVEDGKTPSPVSTETVPDPGASDVISPDPGATDPDAPQPDATDAAATDADADAPDAAATDAAAPPPDASGAVAAAASGCCWLIPVAALAGLIVGALLTWFFFIFYKRRRKDDDEEEPAREEPDGDGPMRL